MIRSITVAFLAQLLTSMVSGQLRNAHWPVSPGNWLYIDNTGPTITGAELGMREMLASISTPQGELILYGGLFHISNSQGDTLVYCGNGYECVYNRGQGLLFLPWPGDTNHVIAFYIQRWGTPFLEPEFGYHLFERNEATGIWGLAPGGEYHLQDSTTFKLTAVAHANGEDYWIITHLYGSDTFLAYQLTSAGVNPTPTISHAGMVLPPEPEYSSDMAKGGHLVASADGTKLVMSTWGETAPAPYYLFCELYHFNAGTGVVTMHTTLPPVPFVGHHGVDISPDGTRLYQYCTTADTGGTYSTLLQYDISSNDSEAIISSRTIIHTDTIIPHDGQGLWGMDMATAPDGRIYLLWNDRNLSVIEQPNALGTACDLRIDEVDLFDTLTTTLPNFCKRYHDSELSIGLSPQSPTPNAFAVWPTLTADAFTVRAERGGMLSIVDAWGRPVAKRALSPGQPMRLDIASQPAGCYVIQLATSNGGMAYQRLIKR